MGGSHGGSHRSGVDALHSPLDTPVHRLDASVKLVCLLCAVLAFVATPAQTIWAFGVYALMVAGVVALAHLPVPVLARRMLIEVPFLLFAIALPIIGKAPRTEFLGVSWSIAGSWSAWAILAKATLGTACVVVLAWTTSVADLLAGLERLRCPRLLVAITGFMVRYLDVVSGELHRLQIARTSRGDDPRWLWQGRAVAATAGTMFIRSFERGERIQQSMLSRGYDGTFPTTIRRTDEVRWFPAVLAPLMAVAVAAVAIMVNR